MPQIGFYQQNQGRSYPFVSPPVGDLAIPKSAVVDFGCLFGIATGFLPDTDVVYLHSVSASLPGFVTFDFRFTGQHLGKYRLAMNVPDDAPEYTIVHFEGDLIDLNDAELQPPYVPYCPQDPGSIPLLGIEAFLVVGDLSELLSLLADTDPLLGGLSHYIEPCLVQSLEHSFVRAISAGNRGRSFPPVPCGSSITSEESSEVDAAYRDCDDLIEDVYLIENTENPDPGGSHCLPADELQLMDGYNCTLIFDETDNSITIQAQAGAGDGVQCEDFSEEEIGLPDGGYAGPVCADYIRSVNGLSARTLRLVGGPGVRVSEDPLNAHTLLISVDLADLAHCGDDG